MNRRIIVAWGLLGLFAVFLMASGPGPLDTPAEILGGSVLVALFGLTFLRGVMMEGSR